jgi:cytochrome c oxidase assembly factor CtaG
MLASSLVLLAVMYGAGVARLWHAAGVGKGISRAEAAAFVAGWLTLVAALIGPLHELSEALLSAHMVQHELLMIVAAPLIALSAPFVAFMWLLPAVSGPSIARAVRRTVKATHVLTAPATVWLLHAFALWVWHLPTLYEAAVADETIHALQHSCFFVSACLFWWGIAHGRYGRLGNGAAVIYIFATAIHSGALGALLTFSSALWYPIYESTTLAFGLTPLEDQQLAGLVMWVPSGVVFLGVGLWFLAAWIRESERRVRLGVSRSLRA